MKQWSVLTALVVALSLATWLVIYRIDGTPPGHGLTVMVVGMWLAIVAAVRRLKG